MDMVRRFVEPYVPSREVFFHRLVGNIDSVGLAMVQNAWNFSEYVHHRQLRESGERYFTHPLAIAWSLVDEFSCYDALTISLAFTHDALEPGQGKRHVTRAYVRAELGEEVALGTYHLTHKRQSGDKKEPIPDYIKRFSSSWQALLAKLVDRLHNMRTLHHCGMKKQQRKAKETRRYYIPLCELLHTMLPDEYRHIASELQHKLEFECEKYQLPTRSK